MVTVLMALAMALAVLPAAAAEPEQRPEERARNVSAEAARTHDPAPPARQTGLLLQGLRLHPGEDGLDVAETARRARPDGD